MYAPPRYAEPRGYAPAAPRARIATVTVGAYDNYFEPKTLNVQPGATVTWRNQGQHDHTVTADDGSWGANIPPGGSYSATFRHPGTYYYYCRHHTDDRMEGTIFVGGGGRSRSGRSGSSGY
jgi:plastocyanin